MEMVLLSPPSELVSYSPCRVLVKTLSTTQQQLKPWNQFKYLYPCQNLADSINNNKVKTELSIIQSLICIKKKKQLMSLFTLTMKSNETSDLVMPKFIQNGSQFSGVAIRLLGSNSWMGVPPIDGQTVKPKTLTFQNMSWFNTRIKTMDFTSIAGHANLKMGIITS